MILKEIVAIYCENHAEQSDTLCGQKAEFQCVEEDCIYRNHWTTKGYEWMTF
jgi:hypothetical protein